MKRSLPIPSAAPVRPQRGVALVIVLILLLVMTVLGVASIRGTVLEEHMSGNMYDRSLAFQAAEAALREAEALIAAPGGVVVPASGCSAGVCAHQAPTVGAPERWLDPAFAGWRTAVVSVGALASPPQFIIEDLGFGTNWAKCDGSTGSDLPPNCLSRRFRVTARSVAADRAQVILQSTVAAP